MAGIIESLPDIFLSEPASSKAISAAVRRGRVRKLGPRLYTKNLVDDPDAIITRNRWLIVALYFPGAIIADRTALENKASPDGSIFLVHDRDAQVTVGPYTLRARAGIRHPDDQPFGVGLYLSSTPRAFLDNMVPSRARQHVARTLSRAEMEQRLDRELRLGGEQRLDALRDDAGRIAELLDRGEELKRLGALIGTLLGSRDVVLETDVARARARNVPFDPGRLALLENLHSELLDTPATTRLDPGRSNELPNLAFFEAYFSNYIEGTKFEVADATRIVFEEWIPPRRPADAHDVLGTFRVVSSLREMTRRPATVAALHELLRSRHAEVMRARPDKGPGLYKSQRNRAGSTVFVDPELVLGTLERGFALYDSLRAPLARAIFMHCLVSEVHPFTDGNGRVARIMMNAELVAGAERRIIIPTIYRNNYLAALKGFTHNGLCEPIIRVLDFAQRYTQAIDFTDLAEAERVLAATNAFVEPEEADDRGVRLVMPRADMFVH